MNLFRTHTSTSVVYCLPGPPKRPRGARTAEPPAFPRWPSAREQNAETLLRRAVVYVARLPLRWPLLGLGGYIQAALYQSSHGLPVQNQARERQRLVAYRDREVRPLSTWRITPRVGPLPLSRLPSAPRSLPRPFAALVPELHSGHVERASVAGPRPERAPVLQEPIGHSFFVPWGPGISGVTVLDDLIVEVGPANQ